MPAAFAGNNNCFLPACFTEMHGTGERRKLKLLKIVTGKNCNYTKISKISMSIVFQSYQVIKLIGFRQTTNC